MKRIVLLFLLLLGVFAGREALAAEEDVVGKGLNKAGEKIEKVFK